MLKIANEKKKWKGRERKGRKGKARKGKAGNCGSEAKIFHTSILCNEKLLK